MRASVPTPCPTPPPPRWGAVTVQATPRDDSYTVTYNGGESNVIALEDGENVILVKVVNPGGYENTYEITVNKVAEISIAFDVTPEDAVVHLQDSFGQRLWPENGVYTLMSSNDYSYTVTKDGYIGQKNGFNLAESGTIEITLEQAPVNETIDKTIYAQWGSFRGEDNLGVTWARTPYTPEDAELLWAAKWGSGWAAAPNPPILVDGDLIVIGGQLHQAGGSEHRRGEAGGDHGRVPAALASSRPPTATA